MMAAAGPSESAKTAIGSNVDDVRVKYHQARSDEQSFASIVLARQVAEAVCAGLESRLPDGLREKYAKASGDLHKQIGIISDKENVEKAGVPKAVVAALRTLQAYGNYAAHYEKQSQRPSQRATASAMASLALVVHWYLFSQGRDPDIQRDDIPLRTPAPMMPGFWERRRLFARALTRRPSLLIGRAGTLPNQLCVDPTTAAEVQLAMLLAYYAGLTAVCERICDAVFSRETTRGLSAVEMDELSILFSQLAELRPQRIPRTVCVMVEDVLRKRASVLCAIRDRVQDVSSLLLEAKQRDPVEDLVLWFERDYLGRGLFARRWADIVRVIVLVVCMVVVAFLIGQASAR